MLTILPSTTAPNKPGHQPLTLNTLGDEQAQNVTGSFGEVLTRSLTPPEEITASVATKLSGTAPARRQPGHQKIAPEDLINAIGLALVPPENRVVKVAPGGSVSEAATNSAPSAVVAPLSSRLVGTSEPTDRPTTAKNDHAGTPAPSEPVIMTTGPTVVAVGQENTGQANPPEGIKPQSDQLVIHSRSGNKTVELAAPHNDDHSEIMNGDDKAAKRPGAATTISSNMSPAAAVNAAKPESISDVPGTATTSGKITNAGNTPPMPPNTLDASAVTLANPAIAPATGPVGFSAQSTQVPVPTRSLPAEVGSSEWGKALGQQVIQMGKTGHHVAELQLNPPGLGPLKVTLSVNDQQMQATFVSEHSSVRAAVEAALPQLRTALAESGIALGNTSVSADSQQQTAFAHNSNGQPAHKSYRGSRMVDTDSPANRARTDPFHQNDGITVDTYA